MSNEHSTVCGPFDLHEVIGEGGMARVWRGVHRAEQVPVAVKVITDAKAREPDYQDRFEREVQAVAALNHPNVVTVLDYGQISATAARSEPSLIEGSPYLAMELARGGTLRDHHFIWDWPSLHAFALDLLDALAHAHARDVIHRDIKPENILCQVDGGRIRFKLSDFGIAHAGKAERTSDTGNYVGASAGTPYYMPPEQLMGDWREFGPWTDLYAVGCLLYEVACGEVPFDDDNFVRLANMHINLPFPEPEPRFSVPDDFDSFLRRLVAKRPHQRFLRAADAAHALQMLGASADGLSPSDRAQKREVDVDARTLVDPGDVDTIPDADTRVDHATAATELDLGSGGSATYEQTTLVLTRPLGDGDEVEEEQEEPTPERFDDTVEYAAFDFEPPPPIPESWALGESEHADARLVGAGLGLFGLRAIPLVDRIESRDVIWSALRKAAAEHEAVGVSLRGPAGTGKSRLAEWMTRRAHEVGAAIVLRAAHSPEGGPAEGISRMLEDVFGTWSLDQGDVHERILARLREHPGGASPRDVDIETLARGLTELVRPSAEELATDEDGPTYHFSGPGERYRAVADLMRILAVERPIVLWVDDAPWGPDALDLVAYLLDNDHQMPLVVLLTSRSATLDEDPRMAERLEQLEADERITRLDVESMSSDDHVELIRRTLDLDDELTRMVEQRTQGNPLFAVQLIGDWVSRGILEVGENGFRLRQGSVSTLPGDVHDLWIQRVERLLEKFPREERWDLRLSMELAAMLGQHVDEVEWREVCKQRGVAASDDLVSTMVEQGLARRGRGGASFAHSLLTESLRRASERAGRAAEHRLCCVRALEVLYPNNQMKIAGRRAQHLLAAGRAADALAPLKLGFHYAMDHGNYPEAWRLLKERESVTDALGLDEESRMRVENLWMRGQISMPSGDNDAALESVRRAADIARRHGWRVDVGHALVVMARVLRDRGKHDEALEVLDEALVELEAVDDGIGLMLAEFSKGLILLRRGEFEAARARWKVSLRHARACSKHSTEAKILSFMGYAWFAQDRYDEARTWLEEARANAERIGDGVAIVLSTRHLGEIARFEQDWAQARSYYERALAVERSRGGSGRSRYLDLLNLAIVDIGAGDFDAAREQLEPLPAAFEEAGLLFVVPIAHLATAAAAAGQGELSACVEALDAATDASTEELSADKDVAWLTRRAGELAEAHNWESVAGRLYARAAATYDQLGDEAAAREMDERAERLDAASRL